MPNKNKEPIKDRLKRYSKEFYNFYKNYTGIAIIVSIGIGVYGIMILDIHINNGNIYKHNLASISQLATAIGVIFSGVAIILLYKNYRLQQEEMNKLTKGSLKANDLQVVLYEKKILDEDIYRFLNNNEIYKKDAIIHEINEIVELITAVTMTNNDNLRNELANQLFHRRRDIENKLFEDIFKFFFEIWNRINTLENLISSREVVKLFYLSFPKEFVQLFERLYDPRLQEIIDEYSKKDIEKYSFTRVNNIKLFRQSTSVIKYILESNQ
ncbi:hypothetical protein [Marivirga harenae]|uniref:hypothetical protein n=1 Tax=Marivirga harenae TaxID=2010992 RepID=UPI0026DEDC75|nr:hypothetical protein [Marivirga harenae]WKV11252.1 hypothetical protein Q3Y49_13655 [Marivirga harenae]